MASKQGDQLSVFAFATVAVAAIVGIAFAVGYVIGKMLL